MPPRLYADLAHLWPILSPPEDYAAEAAIVRRILRRHLGPSRRARRWRILELGAGGGHTLVHLQRDADAVAADLSPQMLAHCHTLCPGVRTVAGDMRSLRLRGELGTFDAVLLHDAIDYMTTARDVQRTLRTAHAHLRKGGVALVAPTYTRETFTPHQAEHDQAAHDAGVLTYLQYVHDPNPRDTTFELLLVYLIEEHGRVRVEEDRHTCGLFPTASWTRWMRAAGFRVELPGPSSNDLPHTMFVGTKR